MDYSEQLKILKATKHVHTNWYVETYPDVSKVGLKPAEHYLRYGADLGRNPGKNFNTLHYLKSYPEATKSGLNPLVYYWLHGKAKGHRTKPVPKNSLATSISANLFSLGFTQQAFNDLESLLKEGDDSIASAEAGRELALLQMRSKTQEGYSKALRYINEARSCKLNLKLRRQLALIEILALFGLGDKISARASFWRSYDDGAVTPDLRLAAANLESGTEAKLFQINIALALHGISPVSLTKDRGVPLYDRLTATTQHSPVTDGPKISVLLAAYEAQSTLATALRSLQKQTWKNIEVIVLDDCSPTLGTKEVTEGFSRFDPRIIYVRMEENGGAYIARNKGLDLATGDLITIHDADDWSHPLKLEIQARFLLDNDAVLGCTSEQARCTERLEFTKVRGGGALTVFNTSSFMWKVDPVRDALGYWDTVRFGADNEFIRRMCAVFGKTAFVKMLTGPLSFQREADTSITGDPIKGIDIGGYYGVRKEYLLAQQHWHGRPDAVLKYRNNPGRRPFPVPEMMNRASASAKIPHYDVAIVGDFRIGSPDVNRAVEILADIGDDYVVALVELPYYDPANGKLQWCSAIRELVDGKRVSVLVYGDKATCTREIYLTSQNGIETPRFFPELARADFG